MISLYRDGTGKKRLALIMDNDRGVIKDRVMGSGYLN